MLIVGCNDDPQLTSPEDLVLNEILPEKVSIDIPDALSFETTLVEGQIGQINLIEGKDIYNNLRGIIRESELSVNVLRELIDMVAEAEIDSAVEFSIVSNLDNRQKDISIRRDVTRNFKNYSFQMDVSDGGVTAAQLLWRVDPIDILAILKPFDLNRNTDAAMKDVFKEIVYNEEHLTYDELMGISITNMPESSGFNNIQIVAGKIGSIVEVFGNSNHPNLILIDESFTGGRNYAFVARANAELDVGVALLALPPSAVDTNENLFDEYAVLNILEQELETSGIVDQSIIDLVLNHATAPSFYSGAEGFLSSGANIPDNPAFSNSFIDLSSFVPFVPRDIRDLEISFSID